ncbi:helix-turn-helix transcriptional regulator [Demequina sediminicola]|uniref:helix-turn-helix transcriptional regulator n=1 Tax=Demequina sediminicola TaxID=1095026 RepID=UPI000785C974|nr:helix-turn-helix transcriptional regulator [Demequina sediminicola]
MSSLTPQREALAESVSASAESTLIIAPPTHGVTTWLSAVSARLDPTPWCIDVHPDDPPRAAWARLLGRRSEDLRAAAPDARALLASFTRGDSHEPEAVAEALCRVLASDSSRVPWMIDCLSDLDTDSQAVAVAVAANPNGPRVIASSHHPVDHWPGTQVDLPDVPASDLRALLVDTYGFAPQVAETIALTSNGNPSVALGCATLLTTSQRRGTDLLPIPLPMTDAHLQAVRRDIDTTSSDAPDPDSYHQRGRQAVQACFAFPTAGAAGAELVGASAVWTDHALIEIADPETRRRWHAELDVDDSPTSLMHRAAASIAADSDLADHLSAASRDALAHQDTMTAERLLVAATGLTSTGPTRWARLRELAVLAGLAGRPGGVDRWLALRQHESGVSDPVLSAGASVKLALSPEQRDELRLVRDDVTATAPERAAAAVNCVVIGITGCMPGIVEDTDAMERLAVTLVDSGAVAADSPQLRFLTACVRYARFLAGGDLHQGPLVHASAPAIIALMNASQSVPDVRSVDSAPTRAAMHWGIAALADEQWDDAEKLLRLAAEVEGKNGWHGLRLSTTGWLAETLWRRGEWEESESVVRDALTQFQLENERSVVLRIVAERAGALREDRADPSAGHDDSPSLWSALRQHGLGMAAASHLRFDDATVHLWRAHALMNDTVTHDGLIWWRPELIEALAYAGQIDAAQDLTKSYSDRASAFPPPPSGFALAWQRACAACHPNQRSVRALTQAIDEHRSQASAFCVARTELALSYLQRAEDPDAARALATQAATVFDQLGATGFAHQAHVLAQEAITDWGVAQRALTHKGKDVVCHVANGLTNREISRTLRLSEKTVEFHISKAYRTLGVNRRTEIAAIARP